VDDPKVSQNVSRLSSASTSHRNVRLKTKKGGRTYAVDEETSYNSRPFPFLLIPRINLPEIPSCQREFPSTTQNLRGAYIRYINHPEEVGGSQVIREGMEEWVDRILIWVFCSIISIFPERGRETYWLRTKLEAISIYVLYSFAWAAKPIISPYSSLLPPLRLQISSRSHETMVPSPSYED